MYYNICYDLASILILIIMLLARNAFFDKYNELTRSFVTVVLLTFITCMTNIMACLCYDCIIPNSDRGMLVVETIYLLLAIYSCYACLRMMSLRVDFSSDMLRMVNFFLIITVSIALMINVGPGFIFRYENHEFIGSILFRCVYFIYAAFFVEMFVILMIKRKNIRTKILLLISSILFLPLTGILVQFINDRLIVSDFSVTVALLFFAFTLSEQDYEGLQSAYDELERSKRLISRSMTDAEAARRVKSLFMKKMSASFELPLEEINKSCDNMSKLTDDNELSNMINITKNKSNEMQSLVKELLAESGAN